MTRRHHLPKGDDWLPILLYLPAGAFALYAFVIGPTQGVFPNSGSAIFLVVLLGFAIVATLLTSSD